MCVLQTMSVLMVQKGNRTFSSLYFLVFVSGLACLAAQQLPIGCNVDLASYIGDSYCDHAGMLTLLFLHIIHDLCNPCLSFQRLTDYTAHLFIQ